MKAPIILLSNFLLVICQYFEALHEEKPAILIDFDHLELEGGGQVSQGLLPIDLTDSIIDEAERSAKGRRAVKDDSDGFVELEHWSRCADFKDVGTFNVRYILNNTWIPFYIWSASVTTYSYLNFTLPAAEEVASFRRTYELLGLRLDWSVPSLLMLDSQRRYLLVCADRRGLFHVMLKLVAKVEEHLEPGQTVISAPDLTVRIKVIYPYLLVISCSTATSILLAPIGKVPAGPAAKAAAARSTGFKGNGFPMRRLMYTYVSEEYLRQTKSDYIRHMQRNLDKLAART